MDFMPLGLAFLSGLTFGTVLLRKLLLESVEAKSEAINDRSYRERAATQEVFTLGDSKHTSDQIASLEQQVWNCLRSDLLLLRPVQNILKALQYGPQAKACMVVARLWPEALTNCYCRPLATLAIQL